MATTQHLVDQLSKSVHPTGVHLLGEPFHLGSARPVHLELRLRGG